MAIDRSFMAEVVGCLLDCQKSNNKRNENEMLMQNTRSLPVPLRWNVPLVIVLHRHRPCVLYQR